MNFEPERYEQYESPVYHFQPARRDFFKILGGGIVVLYALRNAESMEAQGRGGNALPQEIGAWLHIAENGEVSVFSGKVEIGQNARTALAQVVAEELTVPVTQIKMVMADTDLTPYDQGTHGSMTTPTHAPQLRRVAATAREMLLDLAAETAKVDRASLKLADGKISYPGSKTPLEFGKLAQGQKLVKTVASTSAPTTPADKWRVAGKPMNKIGGRAFVTGKHKYASDIKLPGMLHGKVLRPVAFGAQLVAADTKAAESISGVTVVHDGDFVGVAAANDLAASKALGTIRAEWKTTPQVSGRDLFTHLKKPSEGRPQANNAGSMDEGLAAADHKLEHTYTVAFIAHTPLEPRAAVAEWKEGKLTVWTGTQQPFGVKSALARAFSVGEDKVRVIAPDMGSGYGGKHTGECAIEAARLARAAGKPVKIVWTREEEFTWGYFRPAGVIEIRAGVRKDGVVTAWEFHNYNSGSSAIQPKYDFPNRKIEFHPSQSPLRQGSYRGLAATANHFARETHMDEMAALVKMDPLEFRLKNIKDDRLRGVLEAAAKTFEWGKNKPPKDGGYGLACGFEKGSYVASCAEVAVDPATGRVQVKRVVTSFECGAIVNPEGLKNQVEGAIVQGIGGALLEAIEFDEGKILNPRFSRYQVPRFSDTPVLQTVLLDRKDLPSAGAGETPIVTLAPAVGNAIFSATGQRRRSLPMRS